MNDSPKADEARDDFILQERLAGRSARSIAKELHCAVSDVDVSLDRVLPRLDNAARLRHISLDLQRLDALLKTFLARAIDKVDTQAGLLVVKILERKSGLLGLDSPQRLDVVQLQAEEAPQGHDKIFEMIMRIKHGPDWQPGNGNGSDPAAGDSGDSAVGVL